MLPLPAELTTDARAADGRGAARRTLRLEVRASSAQDATGALIRNLSERGLLIETDADLAIGETIQVDLPEAGVSAARIIWTSGAFFGCEFVKPVSRAAVSAALLRAPAEQPQPLSALPPMPAHASFSDEPVQPESDLEFHPPHVSIAAMASLGLFLLIVILFVYALLVLPFST